MHATWHAFMQERHQDHLESIYNRLTTYKCFPDKWKLAKLVLLPKTVNAVEDSISHIPICLMDVEGKLYQHLILKQVKREIEGTGDLSGKQYGFRVG